MFVPELVERDHELRSIDAAVEAVRGGRAGAVLVVAPPGLGKTALIGTACSTSRRAGVSVLRATAGEHDPSYSVVRELFAEALADPDDELLSGIGGPAAAIFRPDPTSATDAFAVVHALYWVLARLAERAPVLVAIDDVHWADPASVRWISFVLARLDELPVLLVLGARTQELDERHDLTTALGGRPDLVRLRPAALTRDGIGAMVPGVEADPIAAMTAGNPFLVRIVDSALRNGELSSADLDPERLAQIDTARLRDLVDARVARLGADAVALTNAVATLGDGAALRDAAAVAQLDLAGAGTARDALVAADVLVERPDLGFVHPLLRAAVIQHVRPTERSALHRRAAAQLASIGAGRERVARHFLFVDPAGSPEVVAALREGARVAAASGAAEAAIELLERALVEPPGPGDRAAVLAALAEAGFTVGHARTTDWAMEAMQQVMDPVEHARIASRMALILRLQGRVGDGFRKLLPKPSDLDLLDHDLALRIRAEVCAAAVATPSRRSSSRDVLAELEREPLTGTGPGARAAAALLALEHVLQNHPAEHVRRLADVAIGEGDLSLEGFPRWYATVAYVHAGELVRGERLLDDAVAEARRRGSLVGLELATLHRAYTRLLLGDLRGAEADVQESLDNSRAGGWEIGHAAKIGYAIRVLLQRGDVDAATGLRDAWEGHDRSLPWYGDGAELTWYEAFYLEGRGRLELRTGAPADALQTFETIRRSLPEDWVGGAVFTWRTGAARALLALGRRDEALALAQVEAQYADRFGDVRVSAGAHRLLGMCLGGNAGIERIRAAIKGLDAAGAVLDAAWTRYDLGVSLRRARHNVEARVPLMEAREWARRSGAGLLYERATEELVATGARPRREADRGVDALTGRERRVAELAAAGHSNPEIAQQLFVSRKTVESHLAQVFRKLEITSRRQLASELGRT
jgi:DNA-binding CsgD family transcriptional regulator/tetratricopeptide (TPR) repeat protein